MTRLTLEDIIALNIEISARCNASCPFCSRRQKVRAYGDHEITLADYRRLPVSLIRRLRRISFGGNFGDLCCNPAFPAIAAYTREQQPSILLEGDTNGSFQDAGWWRSVGASFGKGAMVFSIDGLEDTHRLHRRGTDYGTVVRNLSAFVDGGGLAIWKFIVFRHNEHQIRLAEQRAGELGCTRFYAVASRDFDEKRQPPQTLPFQLKREVFDERRAQLPSADRRALCRPVENRTLYIAADGTVHPCCFAHLMFITEHNDRFRFIVPLVETHLHRINFKTRPLAEIVEGAYFRAILESSPHNAYCMTKCNRDARRTRRELVLHDRFF